MKPLKRHGVHKSGSVKKFKHNIGRTKLANVTSPMRGGIRM